MAFAQLVKRVSPQHGFAATAIAADDRAAGNRANIINCALVVFQKWAGPLLGFSLFIRHTADGFGLSEHCLFKGCKFITGHLLLAAIDNCLCISAAGEYHQLLAAPVASAFAIET